MLATAGPEQQLPAGPHSGEPGDGAGSYMCARLCADQRRSVNTNMGLIAIYIHIHSIAKLPSLYVYWCHHLTPVNVPRGEFCINHMGNCKMNVKWCFILQFLVVYLLSHDHPFNYIRSRDLV